MTLVRPTTLTSTPLTGMYRAGEHRPLRGFPTISRAGAAHCLLARLDDPTPIRTALLVSW